MGSISGSRCPTPSNSTSSVNERRKAQNRASQKKYRARQKLRMEVAKAVLLDGQYPDLSQLHGIRSPREPSIEYHKDLIPDSTGRQLESLHAMLQLESNPTFQDEIRTQNPVQREAFDDWASSERRSTDLNSIYVASDQIDQCARQTVSSFELMDDMNTPLDLSSLNSPLELMHYQDTVLTAEKRPGETEEASTQPDTDSSSTKQVSHATHVRNHSTETTSRPTSSRPGTAYGPPLASPSISDSATMIHSSQLQCSTEPSPRNRQTSGDDGAVGTGDFTTPLLTAISLGNLEMASLLTKFGARLDTTALHRCVERGDRKMACGLLELGADILATDSKGVKATCLQKSVELNDKEMVRALLQWCQKRDEERRSRIAEDTGSKVSESLLQRVLNHRQPNGMTLVHQAVSLQYINIVKVLLDFGADVNIGND
ncbi:aps2, partial [Metarhizium majus ARSEF 297]